MKLTILLRYLVLIIIMMAEPLFGGSITITLVGINPLTINIKGDTQDEEAGSMSIYLYYRDDGTTDLTEANVDASQIETGFGWGTGFETKSIETGSWDKDGHTFTRRLYYDNADNNSPDDDYWTTSGINAIVVNFTTVGTGHAYIELNGSDAFAGFSSSTIHTVSFSNQDAALPVELSSFTVLANLNNVNLSWKTETEVNNNGFEVERGIRSQKSGVSNWEKVGFVQGAGNSNSPKEYSFTDKNLTGGTKFVYRLKQIDNDGRYQYSKEVEVEVIPKQFALYQNYPNPFNPVTEIKYNLPEASRVVLNVYNIIGQQVASLVNGNIDAGFHSVTFDGSNLPSGTYIYRLQTGNFVQTKKMVLLK